MSTIDIAVPSYNYGRFLGDCLDSICAQEVDGLRVLVIDNASTDDSVAIAREAARADPRIELREPPAYLEFVQLMQHTHLVLTDSGGVQEEAPALGLPVLVLRRTTERPEGVTAGTAKLVGTERADIVREASLLLGDQNAYNAMSHAANPYGDGKAGERIAQAILHWAEQADRPAEFEV